MMLSDYVLKTDGHINPENIMRGREVYHIKQNKFFVLIPIPEDFMSLNLKHTEWKLRYSIRARCLTTYGDYILGTDLLLTVNEDPLIKLLYK